jgi:hypothetical protein
VTLGIIARHLGDEDDQPYFRAALDLWPRAWETHVQSPALLLENKALALLGLGRSQEALTALQDALNQRLPGDQIEFFRYDMLRESANPPDGLDEMIALVQGTRDNP